MDLELETVDALDARRFEIAVKRLADSLSYGTDRSPFLGSGLEFLQSRPYQPGDPVKAIDWRVTARTRTYHVKEYETPKRLPVYLLLDTSASMTISSVSWSKYARAVHIASGIALACLERVSPVGVLGVGERRLRVRPSLSCDQIFQWMHALRRHRVDERTALGRRLAELGPTLRDRALLIALSDLHDPEGLPALKRLGQVHDCAVIQLQDPAETNLRGAGFLRAREAETERTFVTRGRWAWTDPERVARDLRRAGIDHLLVRTDLPFVHALRHFLKSRHLLGRGAR